MATILGCLVVARPAARALTSHVPIDFTAYACGGSVLASGADPYRAEPLRSCEARAYANAGMRMVRYLTIPAPLPPYALAGFALLARVPFGTAVALWTLGIVGCGTFVAFAIARLSGSASLAIPLAVFGALVWPSLDIGQLAPLEIAGVCSTALALRAGSSAGVALGLAVAMVEPHVGLPIAVAILLFGVRMRVVAVGTLGLLGALSLAVGGFALNVEYARDVIPAQAHEGLLLLSQYGASALLAWLGVAAPLALALGSASYLVACAAGIWFARGVARRANDTAPLALVPAAFTVIGGPYVHLHNIAVALPLAFYLAARTDGAPRAWLDVACIFLAIPWAWLGEGPLQNVLPVARPMWDPMPEMARAAAGSRLAEDTRLIWLAAFGARDHRTDLELVANKLPTWFALLTIAVATARARSATCHRVFHLSSTEGVRA